VGGELPVTVVDVARLYEAFGYAVFRRCVRIVRNPSTAEDVLQDVFVRVLRHGEGYRGGSALAWLQRIADRACLDRIRRDGHAGSASEAAADPAQRPDAGLPVPEASRLLGELLAVLPEKLREIAILYFVDDMSQVEIAEALGCSTMTVKRRLRALREQANHLTGIPWRSEATDVEC
jgi:RNA polymerase sigma-70 factor (ECF subfamily)